MCTNPDYSWTYATHPEVWNEGPSWLLKVENPDGSQDTWASGWHRRQIAFEYPRISFDADTGHVGEAKKLPETAGGIRAFELEISLDHVNDSIKPLELFVGTDMAKRMISSMEEAGPRVSANRTVPVDQKIPQYDLYAINMPARSGNYKERLRAIPRRCRIFRLPCGVVSLYEPLDENRLKDLRWPHNGIWLNRGEKWYSHKVDNLGTLDSAMLSVLRYMEYNIGNWKVEEALWRIGVYVVRNDRELESSRKDFATLSLFVKDSVLSLRSLQRRILPRLRKDNTEGALIDSVQKSLDGQEKEIEAFRDFLREDLEMLSEASQLVQARASERLNRIIELLSAVFLLPSLIIAFFSMSILSAADSTALIWTEVLGVFLFCVISALLVFLLLRRKRK